jgi:Xaa-Pro aminopeptidase
VTSKEAGVDERQARVAASAAMVGAGWSIITSPDLVCYATGFEVPYEAGPSPFAGGPATALVAPDGTAHLIVVNVDEQAAAASRAASVTGYEGFSTDHPLHGYTEQAATVARVAAAHGLCGAVAVEQASLTWAIGEALAGLVDRLVPFDRELSDARQRKTADEVAALRRCAAVTDAGHAELLRAVRAGRTELEVFADVRRAMETEAGGRVCVVGELSAGRERAAGVFDWPRTVVLAEGDPVVADLAPRVAGYWGDSCNTVVVGGEPDTEQRRAIAAARAGIETACETLRPGITAGALDALVRGAVVAAGGVDYLHHSGHGIGTSVHENPRLVPGDPTVLEPGMVIMVEPATYRPGIAAARCEWMFLVTESGNEVLSAFEHRYV